MKTLFTTLFLLSTLPGFAQKKSAAFQPQPIVPGGEILPLYPPDSPFLKKDRIDEPEKYNTATNNAKGAITNVINIHNPSIEVHLVPNGPSNTGTAVIVAPGGGHKILWVGPEGADYVPIFAKVGVSTIILRNRLRIDGYEPTTDAVNDALQAIRLVRSKAKEWKLDPAKIGMIGFSAGAELSAPAALFFEDFEKKNNSRLDPLAGVSATTGFCRHHLSGTHAVHEVSGNADSRPTSRRVSSPAPGPGTASMRCGQPTTICPCSRPACPTWKCTSMAAAAMG